MAFGYIDPSELLAKVHPSILNWWAAVHRVQPIGDDQLAWPLAHIAAGVFSFSGSKLPPSAYLKFMDRDLHKLYNPEKVVLSPQEKQDASKKLMNKIVSSFGGTTPKSPQKSDHAAKKIPGRKSLGSRRKS